MNDADSVSCIKKEVAQLGLSVEARHQSGDYFTLYVTAPVLLPLKEQLRRLRQGLSLTAGGGVTGLTLTTYDDPPYKDLRTGLVVDGHPRHGDPLLIIDSVLWGVSS